MFSLRGSSHLEANCSSVNTFLIQYMEGINGTMQELMKQQKRLMMKNCNIICQGFLYLKFIH